MAHAFWLGGLTAGTPDIRIADTDGTSQYTIDLHPQSVHAEDRWRDYPLRLVA